MRLFVERGFDDVTVAEVAEAADVSVNTVFNHFRTKEDLFFGLHETMQAQFAEFARARRPGEPVVAFLRRQLPEVLARFREAPRGWLAVGFREEIQRVFLGSPALQVRAAQFARGEGRGLMDALARALTEDTGAGPDDLRPLLVASQVLSLFVTLSLEAERRRRSGQDPEVIDAALRSTAEAALDLLEHGVGDYGANPTAEGTMPAPTTATERSSRETRA